ncbi:MAG: DNA alkylation repair protein [Calditrichota bacterium]
MAEETVQSILARLHNIADPKALEGMERFGIRTSSALGISMPRLRQLARDIGKNHDLAEALWESGLHEARILASLVAVPGEVTNELMDRWVLDFDSWDLCDQCCSNLFDKTKWNYQKAVEWPGRHEEFVKRAGFVLMACLAVHDKRAPDQAFLSFLPLIRREAGDGRNFVKKAVNWALRQIGKRNLVLNGHCIQLAEELKESDSSVALWIASDALRELTGEKVQQRLEGKSG